MLEDSVGGGEIAEEDIGSSSVEGKKKERHRADLKETEVRTSTRRKEVSGRVTRARRGEGGGQASRVRRPSRTRIEEEGRGGSDWGSNLGCFLVRRPAGTTS